MATVNGSGSDDFVQGTDDAGGDHIYAGSGDDNVEGRNGDDTIYGGSGDDMLLGYDGSAASTGSTVVGDDDGSSDTLYGESGNDTLAGGLGDDSLYGGSGDDSAFGGDGNDDVQGGLGDDLLYGGDGNDTVGAGGDNQGADIMYGGSGADDVRGGTGNDTIYGGDGDDYLRGSGDDDAVYGGNGSDTIVASNSSEDDIVFGGEGGTDLDLLSILGSEGVDVLLTGDEAGTVDYETTSTSSVIFSEIEAFSLTSVADTFDGTASAADQTVDANEGNDSLAGGSGDDLLYGGSGEDLIYGGNGADTFYGGDGDDTLIGQGGSGEDDTLFGGAGNDTIEYHKETDSIDGGSGDDRIVNVNATSNDVTTISGGIGTDTFVLDTTQGGTFTSSHTVDLSAGELQFSGFVRDVLADIENIELIETAAGARGDANANTITATGSFANSLSGEGGDDVIYAGAGDDVLDGGGGDDVLDGGAGNDTFAGGTGNDTLTGGAGNDVFELSSGGGDDLITDFATGDQIDVSALSDVGNVLTDQDGTVTADEITITGGGGSDQILTFPNGETLTVPDGTVDTSTQATQFASLVSLGVPACFAPGTLILTEFGDRPVEDLWPGDRIFTADNGLQTLRWIGRRDVDFSCGANARGEKDKPVEIKSGALGGGLPRRNLVVSPQHRMVLGGAVVRAMFGDGEVLALAKGLTGSDRVRIMKGRRNATYYSLLFDRHEIIYAEGAPSESFRPGPVALREFAPEHREQIYAIYRRLRDEPIQGLGPPARKILSRQETEDLVRTRATSHISELEIARRDREFAKWDVDCVDECTVANPAVRSSR
ncbi:MAG: Hint domain-containing protein [Pseudomonadota bacterium]